MIAASPSASSSPIWPRHCSIAIGQPVGLVEQLVDAGDAEAVDEGLEVPGDVGGGAVGVGAAWSRSSHRLEGLGQRRGVHDGQASAWPG